jgi:hypothetical protein
MPSTLKNTSVAVWPSGAALPQTWRKKRVPLPAKRHWQIKCSGRVRFLQTTSPHPASLMPTCQYSPDDQYYDLHRPSCVRGREGLSKSEWVIVCGCYAA